MTTPPAVELRAMRTQRPSWPTGYARGVAHELRLIEGIAHIFHLDAWNGQPMTGLTPVVTCFLGKYLTRRPLAAGARMPLAPSF
jgi:hypothetical protein